MAKILIIDDSRLIAHLARRILSQHGHEVISAETGLRGLEAARSEQPDIILLDLIMPDIDGFQVCRQLKEEISTANIPVVMLTSLAEQSDKLKGLRSGAVDYVTKPFDEGELVARVNIQVTMKKLRDALEERNRQLEDMVNRDSLTGLFNHRYFHEVLWNDFYRALRYRENLSCILLDIDHFKKVNDAYGHKAGDVVLLTLARIIKDSIRESDVAARYGGEEFALILHHTDASAALGAAERIRRNLEAFEIDRKGKVLNVTASFGIAVIPDNEINTPGDMIEFADKALYEAKAKGRNRAELFDRPAPCKPCAGVQGEASLHSRAGLLPAGSALRRPGKV